jgi:CO/xanthine dehydrogenase FAD-binding subunit
MDRGSEPVRRFEYFAPTSLREAIDIFEEKGEGGRYLAGGTDILIQIKEAHRNVPYLVSLKNIPDLSGIDFSDGDGLRIGAATKMSDIADHPLIQRQYSALSDGAGIVGSYQTRNMATIGGNVCNAAPSAEVSAPLLVLGARARVVGSGSQVSSTRRGVGDIAPDALMDLSDLWVGPGRTALNSGDLVVDFHIPVLPRRSGSYYERHTPRKEMDIAVVGTAVYVALNDDDTVKEARIALCAVAPTVIRAPEAESYLVGKSINDAAALEEAGRLTREASKPISDVRGSAGFRRELVRVMSIQSIRLAAERAQGKTVIKEIGR